ncbi:MAG: hypothetical protein IT307_00720 [Chloroflexi bacterium]|nr:hypothetical protein [Chloroflexota bacterium]
MLDRYPSGMDFPDLALGLSSLTVSRRRAAPLAFDQEQAASAVAEPATDPKPIGPFIPSAYIPTEKRVLALATGGAPAWSRRLKRIDLLVEAATAQLAADWRWLAARHRETPTCFRAAWRHHAEQFDFSRVNDLIARHNLYFPAEANLRMDVHTRDFVGLGGGDFRRRALDATWVLEVFPADFRRAAGGG